VRGSVAVARALWRALLELRVGTVRANQLGRPTRKPSWRIKLHDGGATRQGTLGRIEGSPSCQTIRAPPATRCLLLVPFDAKALSCGRIKAPFLLPAREEGRARSTNE